MNLEILLPYSRVSEVDLHNHYPQKSEFFSQFVVGFFFGEHCGGSRICETEASHKSGGTQLLFWPIFFEKCLKMEKQTGQRGERCH